MSTILFFAVLVTFVAATTSDEVTDRYRPKFHFSVASNWMNDPNGLVYLDGEYHLHYQYYPNGTIWGPMHWGHAVSKDLLTWTDLPIALYPDNLGYIYSGSAVVDENNSAGFKEHSSVKPLVAIFTHSGETQQQSLAYSNDRGRTYTKYKLNPVIPNPGTVDFRDPKVIRYQDKWILLLAAQNRIMFYSSTNLKNWTYMSEFGADPQQGSHGGVWECPDLFSLKHRNEEYWILIVSINPGGPNGGSATQYFVGDFDGESFKSDQVEPLWMDWGPDNYAAISFYNDPKGRVLMMGWMNNWDYANQVPTEGWRGQMTLPRVLGVSRVGNQTRLTSQPAEETKALFKKQINGFGEDVEVVQNDYTIYTATPLQFETEGNTLLHVVLTMDISQLKPDAKAEICFYRNTTDQEICVGYDKGHEKPLYIDRSRSGNVTLHEKFTKIARASAEFVDEHNIEFEVFLDESAMEVFVDGGFDSMTALFYPDQPFDRLEVRSSASSGKPGIFHVKSPEVTALKSMSELRSGSTRLMLSTFLLLLVLSVSVKLTVKRVV